MHVGTAQCNDETIKCEGKKMKVLPNVTKVWLDVILVLPYVMMKLSNVRKNTSTIKCDKITIRSNVSIAQYDNETVK